jgi:hypothetical protein
VHSLVHFDRIGLRFWGRGIRSGIRNGRKEAAGEVKMTGLDEQGLKMKKKKKGRRKKKGKEKKEKKRKKEKKKGS